MNNIFGLGCGGFGCGEFRLWRISVVEDLQSGTYEYQDLQSAMTSL